MPSPTPPPSNDVGHWEGSTREFTNYWRERQWDGNWHWTSAIKWETFPKTDFYSEYFTETLLGYIFAFSYFRLLCMFCCKLNILYCWKWWKSNKHPAFDKLPPRISARSPGPKILIYIFWDLGAWNKYGKTMYFSKCREKSVEDQKHFCCCSADRIHFTGLTDLLF